MIYKTLALLLMALGVWAGLDYQNALHTPLIEGQTITVEVTKGDSLARITDKIQAQQIPLKPFWFKVLAWQNHSFNQLKTGEYELTPGLTMERLLALLVSGKTKRYALTFPEGWSFQQMLAAIEQHPCLDHTLKNMGTTELMAKLGASEAHPEGLFFPDTYFFEKHTSDFSILQRAYTKMQTVITQEWHEKSDPLPYKTPYEALIMASIVEKETGTAFERPMIAGVFIRRLQQGMRLQTDPTVIYGLGANYHGDITTKDLKTPSAYNTYLLNGLPPTPIALPGREAIRAALHPDTSDKLYFVARGDGSHVFSASLAEHNAAVDTYQRKQK